MFISFVRLSNRKSKYSENFRNFELSLIVMSLYTSYPTLSHEKQIYGYIKKMKKGA